MSDYVFDKLGLHCIMTQCYYSLSFDSLVLLNDDIILKH